MILSPAKSPGRPVWHKPVNDARKQLGATRQYDPSAVSASPSARRFSKFSGADNSVLPKRVRRERTANRPGSQRLEQSSISANPRFAPGDSLRTANRPGSQRV